MKRMSSLEFLSFQKLLFLLIVLILTLLLFFYKLYVGPTYIVVPDNQPQTPRFLINIVYFANLFVNPQHGTLLIQEQMKDLIATGLLDVASLHIVLSVPEEFNRTIKAEIYKVFRPTHKILFHVNNENCYEYPGIQLVHSLAFSNGSPHHYLLYFHSKGISRFRGRRETHELALHKTVIAPWRHVLEIFDSHPHIDKIGSTSSDKGWIWWNYWWARASYLIQVEIPIKTERRHYYEDWLSRVWVDPQKDTYKYSNKNCWSLAASKEHVGIGYNTVEALDLVLEQEKKLNQKK